jgi:hypothetical protein
MVIGVNPKDQHEKKCCLLFLLESGGSMLKIRDCSKLKTPNDQNAHQAKNIQKEIDLRNIYLFFY